MFTGLSVAAGYAGNFTATIMSPNAAQATIFFAEAWTQYHGTYYNVASIGGGSVENSTQYTGFRLYPSSGGTATINYRLYGLRD